MNERLSRWLNLSQYPAGADRNRATQIGLVLLVIGVAVVLVFIESVALAVAQNTLRDSLQIWTLCVGMGVLSAAGWSVLRRGHIEAAANLLTLGILIGLVFFIWPQPLSVSVGANIALSVLFVAIIARWYVALLYTISISVYAIAHLWAENTGLLAVSGEEAGSLLPAFFMAFAVFILFATAAGLVGNLHRITQRSERRLQNMALASQLAERLSLVSDVPSVIEQAIDLLWDVYLQADRIRVFVIEDRRVTAVYSSDEGRQEIADPAHAPPLQGSSLLARVNTSRRVALVTDATAPGARAGDAPAPGVRAAIALPLMAGEELIGALEMHSVSPNAFSTEDADLLQPIVNLLALTIARVRLLEATRQRAETNEQQLAEVQARLARLQREGRREVVQAWEQYLKGLDSGQSIQLDLKSLATLRYDAWTPTLSDAIKRGEIVTGYDGSNNVVAAPIRVAGQVIGAMEFELDRVPSAQEMALINQVSERLGLSAENTRLFYEARRVADREVQVNEIGARLQTATDLEGVLTTAAEGLSAALGAPRVSVRIGLPTRLGGDA